MAPTSTNSPAPIHRLHQISMEEETLASYRLVASQCMLRPQNIDCSVPPENRIRSRIADCLSSSPPPKILTEEILFRTFYSCCREEWLTRVLGSDVIREGALEQVTYYCWEPHASEMVIQQMNICYTDVDNTSTTYQLLTSTLSSGRSSHLHFTTNDSSISSSSSNTCPTLTVEPVDPQNGAARTHSSATCNIGKPESEVNDFTLPLVVAAPISVTNAVVSSPTSTSSADLMTTATATVQSSSFQPAAFLCLLSSSLPSLQLNAHFRLFFGYLTSTQRRSRNWFYNAPTHPPTCLFRPLLYHAFWKDERMDSKECTGGDSSSSRSKYERVKMTSFPFSQHLKQAHNKRGDDTIDVKLVAIVATITPRSLCD
ncbi:hypothetical protein TSMEX_003110 [Taenia solium]|eukprot:TsM_000132500 transcript=TsM_000132500 gene=TsM_000132500